MGYNFSLDVAVTFGPDGRAYLVNGKPGVGTFNALPENLWNFTSNIDRLMRPCPEWPGVTMPKLSGLLSVEAALVLDDVWLDWMRRPLFYFDLEVPQWGNFRQCKQFVSELCHQLRRYPNGRLIVI